MADRRFHAYAGALALTRIAELVGAALPAGADGSLLFDDVASLAAAGPAQISFLENRKYLGALAITKAGACLVHPSLSARVPAGCHALAVANPYLAYASLAAAFHPPQRTPAGVHPTAVVDVSARLGEGVSIGPYAVVMAGAKLGAGVEIGPAATIGANVELGDFVVVGANASVSHALVGPRTRLYPGVRIGQDGFGFALSPTGFVKVPQLGLVRIGADCEVGANSCIDRGSAGDTVIGDGTWIDNLVQIGHNVKSRHFWLDRTRRWRDGGRPSRACGPFEGGGGGENHRTIGRASRYSGGPNRRRHACRAGRGMAPPICGPAPLGAPHRF